jgi:DNA modification methylase
VDCVITSPPYYGLRDYGIENQIGQENSPKEYLDNLIVIFSECKRIIKKSGSIWINIGDSYGGTGSKGNHKDPKNKQGRNGQVVSKTQKLNPKSLLQIPERLSIRLQDELGLIKRNTVIWYKPNVMPSSVKDRFTVDYEPFLFFTKNPKYYFETQYEPLSPNSIDRYKYKFGGGSKYKHLFQNNGTWENPVYLDYNQKGRLKRCVWEITTKSFKGAHFAVFPEDLIETPIRACCPINGVVLDPFMGSGTVGVVAQKQHKNFIGIELNEKYIEIANKRIGKLLESYIKVYDNK